MQAHNVRAAPLALAIVASSLTVGVWIPGIGTGRSGPAHGSSFVAIGPSGGANWHASVEHAIRESERAVSWQPHSTFGRQLPRGKHPIGGTDSASTSSRRGLVSSPGSIRRSDGGGACRSWRSAGVMRCTRCPLRNWRFAARAPATDAPDSKSGTSTTTAAWNTVSRSVTFQPTVATAEDVSCSSDSP